eukprot:CAMPEP_0194477332 /NCGR_PEP_ID=MMETSP0253-20130528/1098_1 /TAXON_ID=2966 /ORGANISM="Noctiluca scintillans" /LENGTH=455 /DNA_ID=CAMNT_0039316295 /DNA_START=322 /DNA_END=1691 /DNA_ORIENTATION=+
MEICKDCGELLFVANNRDGAWDTFLLNVQRSGPVFVKLGQWAATRRDLVPEALCAGLGRLHDTAPPHGLEHTHRILTKAFTESWYTHFLIEPVPVGSGCIAQVYAGRLKLPARELQSCSCLAGLRRRQRQQSHCDTEKVAIKVVHPQVRRAIELDLRFLEGIAMVVDALHIFDNLGVSLAIRQFVNFLEAQADFRIEATNLHKFREDFEGRDFVVPRVFDEWVTKDVLMMSFEEGQPLTTLMKSDNTSVKQDAWKHIVDGFWAMIFVNRFVHGDMHPGNVLWRMEGDHVRLVLLDCGLAVDLRGEAGKDLSMMVEALMTKEEEEVGRLLMTLTERVGSHMDEIHDQDGFMRGIAELIRTAKSCKFKLSRLNAGGLMAQSLLLGRKHCVRFDTRFVNLMVAMIVLQGVALQLHSEGDFMGRIRPFVLGATVRSVNGDLLTPDGSQIFQDEIHVPNM